MILESPHQFSMFAKNNSKKLWFKNKSYGYGWYPASWEGWLVVVVYFVILTVVIKDFLPVALAPHDRNVVTADVWWYLGKVFALTLLLIIIARLTGEKPEWRWGGKKVR